MTMPGWNGMEANGYTQLMDMNWETSGEYFRSNVSRPLTFSHAPGTTLSRISPALGSMAEKINLMPTGVGIEWSQTQLDGRNCISQISSTASKSYPDASLFPAEFHSQPSQPTPSTYNWIKSSTPDAFPLYHSSISAENVSFSSDSAQPGTSRAEANGISSEKAPVKQESVMPEIRFVSNNVVWPAAASDSPAKKLRRTPYPKSGKTASASPIGNTPQLTKLSIDSRTVSPNRAISPATRQTSSPDAITKARPLELAMPLKHLTGAQNLLSWPAIRNLLPVNFADWFIRGGPASEGIRNHEFMPRNDVGYFLKRDLSAIDRAEKVFMDRIFKLHPLLDSKQLHESIKRFKSTLVNALQKPSSKDHSTTRKRKRDTQDESKRPDAGLRPRIRRDRGFPAMNISRTLENAIVLLVIGLGLICGRATPNFEVESIVNPRRQTEGSLPGFSHYHLAVGIIGDFFGAVSLEYIQANILACLYRGQLTDVHGSHHHILNAAWSCWTLLHSPSLNGNMTDGSAKPYAETTETKESRKTKNLTMIAFWSIIQLESDILAEVELLPSGISRLEKSMDCLLNADSLGLEAPEKDDIMQSYSDQIQLRRTLNNVHTELYEDKASSASELEKPNLIMMAALNDNLESWRDRLESSRSSSKPKWNWTENHKSSDINEARTRGKYFGAKYIIHRPALEYLLNRAWRKDQSNRAQGESTSPTSTRSDNYKASNGKASPDSIQSSPISADQRLWDAAKICVESAKRSTTVFDDIPAPLILTNIYGTAQAQFGNVLVLMATYQSGTSLADLLDRQTMSALLNRTIRFLKDYRGCSPGMGKDIDLLEKIKKRFFFNDEAYLVRGRRK